METKRTKIGFTFYKEEETEIISEEIAPMEVINNSQEMQKNESAGNLFITPAHKETIERLEMVRIAIAGKGFGELADERKQELIDELTYLSAINTQLTFSY